VRNSRVVFVENRDQAAAIGRESLDPQTTVVALTGEAVQALEEFDLAYQPVSAFAQPRSSMQIERQFTLDYVRILVELESSIASRDARARQHEGFLTGQAYHAYFSVVSVAMRAFLMRETIRALRPAIVSVFPTAIDPGFGGGDYAEAPWMRVLEMLARSETFTLERLPTPSSVEVETGSRPRPRRRVHRAPKAIMRRLERSWPRPARAGRDEELRLLFVRYPGYDWGPVTDRLRRLGGTECFWLDGAPFDPARDWTFVLGNVVTDLWRSDARVVAPAFAPDADEGSTYAGLVDEWLSTRASVPRLDVQGMDLFPALAPNLRSMAAAGPAIAEHADTVADAALESVQPHAVCFVSIPWLSGKRAAERARLRGIPVICYQHGGSYGTHRRITHELMDWAHADYFLSYGEGIRPPERPTFPLRARFVPVGSAAIEARRPKRRHRARSSRTTRVLWVAEFAGRNAYSYDVGEDTQRYLVERRCLELLSGARDLRVTFRPYAGQETISGVLRWLELSHAERIGVDVVSPLAELARRTDVVISDTYSGTVWNQIIAWGKPFVLYCDPNDLDLDSAFAADLARACHWCTDREQLLAAIERLSVEPDAFIREAMAVDTAQYLQRYVLHDGHPVDRCVSLLEQVRRDGEILNSRRG